MVSRQNGDFKRSVLFALAALIAAAVPTLVATSALAETPTAVLAAATDSGHEAPVKASTKRPAKHAKKAHARKSTAHAKHDAHAKAAETTSRSKGRDGVSSATPTKGKKTKKTASRGAAARKKAAAKKADSDAPKRPCLGAPVTVDRGGLEGQRLALVDCDGRPRDVARQELSLLARPWSAPRPKLIGPGNEHGHGRLRATPAKGVKLREGEVAPGVRLVDKGLLVRLDSIARRFPGRAISVVSGYRPQSQGSQHQTARALDLRVAGVRNEDVVAFCKTLTDTACGYYPNSSFVHVDVRNPGTGSVTWIDASGPHEAARYVQQWPPPAEPTNDKADDEKSDPDAVPEPHDLTADPWEIDRDPDEPTAQNAAAPALSPHPASETPHRP